MDNAPACLFLLLLIFLRRSKVVWHTIFNFGNLCATNCSFFSPRGAQDSACLAHKSRIYRCGYSARPQLCLFSIAAVSRRKVVRPHFFFSPFAAVQMSNSRCPAERRRPAGTQIPILPLCVPKFPAAQPSDSAIQNKPLHPTVQTAGKAQNKHLYFTKLPHAAKKVNWPHHILYKSSAFGRKYKKCAAHRRNDENMEIKRDR